MPPFAMVRVFLPAIRVVAAAPANPPPVVPAEAGIQIASMWLGSGFRGDERIILQVGRGTLGCACTVAALFNSGGRNSLEKASEGACPRCRSGDVPSPGEQ